MLTEFDRCRISHPHYCPMVKPRVSKTSLGTIPHVVSVPTLTPSLAHTPFLHSEDSIPTTTVDLK